MSSHDSCPLFMSRKGDIHVVHLASVLLSPYDARLMTDLMCVGGLVYS